jgi:hypothetical protein
VGHGYSRVGAATARDGMLRAIVTSWSRPITPVVPMPVQRHALARPAARACVSGGPPR